MSACSSSDGDTLTSKRWVRCSILVRTPPRSATATYRRSSNSNVQFARHLYAPSAQRSHFDGVVFRRARLCAKTGPCGWPLTTLSSTATWRADAAASCAMTCSATGRTGPGAGKRGCDCDGHRATARAWPGCRSRRADPHRPVRSNGAAARSFAASGSSIASVDFARTTIRGSV